MADAQKPDTDKPDRRTNDTVAGAANDAYAHLGGYGPSDKNLTDESGPSLEEIAADNQVKRDQGSQPLPERKPTSPDQDLDRKRNMESDFERSQNPAVTGGDSPVSGP